MGATCSSSVENKYSDLKRYINSKDCLTFDLIETFVSMDNRSPVVMIGEVHDMNESMMSTKRCVTLLTAMKRLVSDCEYPKTKIEFIMEEVPLEILHPIESKRLLDSKKFNILTAAAKVEKLEENYKHGVRVSPFDILHHTRIVYAMGNSLMDGESVTFDYAIAIVRMSIIEAYTEFGADTSGLDKMFKKSDAYVENSMTGRREEITAMYYKKTIKQVELQEHELDTFGENENIRQAIKSRAVRQYTWMYEIVLWCYSFTKQVVQFEDSWEDGDLLKAGVLLDVAMENIDEKHNLLDMFMFLSTCGDYITYAVYIRDKVRKRNSDTIFVIYGGSAHTLNFAKLLNRSTTHRKDISRIADNLCGTGYMPIYYDICRDKGITY